MSAKSLTLLRNSLFSGLGIILASYGILVLITGRPDPIWPLAPAAAGIITALVVSVGFWASGRKAAAIAFDEYSRHEWHTCLRFGFWVAVWLYPLFAVLLVNNIVDYPQAFAAMGTLTGGAPFLLFLWKWARGRV